MSFWDFLIAYTVFRLWVTLAVLGAFLGFGIIVLLAAKWFGR